MKYWLTIFVEFAAIVLFFAAMYYSMVFMCVTFHGVEACHK